MSDIEGDDEVSLPSTAFDQSWFLSKLTFFWFNQYAFKARNSKLKDDSFDVPKTERAETNNKRFMEEWAKEISGDNPSLFKALWRSFKKQILIAALYKLLWGVFVLLAAYYFVFEVVSLVKVRTAEEYVGWVVASFMFICCVLLSLALQQMSSHSTRAGIQLRGALISAIYNKAISVEGISANVGEVIGLVSSDCQRIMDASLYVHYLWSGPLEAFTILALLIKIYGITSLVGFGILILLVPLQFYIAYLIANVREKGVFLGEVRVQIMHEILLAIKLVKFYAWERSFSAQVEQARAAEIKYTSKGGTVKTVNLFIVFFIPPLLAIGIFAVYVKVFGKSLQSEDVFTTLSLFNTLRFPLVQLPRAVRGVAESYTSMKRIQSFLLKPELSAPEHNEKPIIKFKNTTIQYSDNPPVLQNITMKLPAGKLLGIIGPVGSGKSSLIATMLGETRIVSGEMSVGGRFAYVPQTPWVMQATVQENILFGKPYDKKKYERAIFAAGLAPDLPSFPNGDQTEIGERGINISGGQKQRIALARALYHEADVYILDSPLSAVDQHTAVHIFQHAIKDMLKDKTIVLVTHQLQLLSQCDYIAIMKHGEMGYFGKYSEEVVNEEFPWWKDHSRDYNAEKPTKKQEQETQVETSLNTGTLEVVQTDTNDSPPFLIWMRTSGYIQVIVVFLVFMFTQGFRIASDWWVSYWVKNNNQDPDFYLGVYGGLVLAFGVGLIIRGLTFYKQTIKAATKLHNRMFRKILNAPISFFTVTPIGPLLNSFSKDQDAIDEKLPDSLHMALIYSMILLTTLIIVCVSIPYFTIVAVVLLIGFFLMQLFSYRVVKFFKDLVASSNGPIFAHVGETLHGISVVRAFGTIDQFRDLFYKRLNKNHSARFHLDHANLWISFFLDLLGSLLVYATVLFVVGDKSIPSSAAGLAISNSIQMLVFFSLLVRDFNDIQSEISAISRINNYIKKTETEKQKEVENLPESWPSKGRITYKNVVMNYFPHHPPTLKGISFTIKPGEKIGVCGRTGSGKSSLIMALFRLVEISEGKIMIDKRNVSKLNLQEFRSRLAIIPQEPVMFKGTVRSNIDPFNQYPDSELWHALELSGLKRVIQGLDNKLDEPVRENGNNFSLGQKQLICLTRAILKQSRILVLDEATSAMDLETDFFIQKAIRKIFANCTVITIAHRLDTIIDADKILVMDKGNIVEFDTIPNLLAKKNGSFTNLVLRAGLSIKQVLKSLEEKTQEEELDESVSDTLVH
eukprot:TRINITY_DN8721_c0_g1_i1.p1 TRINITY_DN8721_c0_g1~~TRINITY_DN8721_c0_g1_i1.p1  ORF type:complete len:1258 (+),score=294.88 TRINITY_DN8721_c0_g1_i1:29-3775(+)